MANITEIIYFYSPLTDIPELPECFAGLTALPIAPSRVHMKIKGPLSMANAFRRVLLSEMPGYAISVPFDAYKYSENTDKFMSYNIVNARIELLPLVPIIPEDVLTEVAFKLNVENKSATLMEVYAGDIEIMTKHKIRPIFNPTFKIADLQPGKSLKIEGYKIESGVGLAKYNACCGAVCVPLDIEKEEDSELLHSTRSGFKVSSQMACPKYHHVKFYIPATYGEVAEVKAVLQRAVICLRNRLRNINLDDRDLYKIFEKDGRHEAVLKLPKETVTIGNLLVQYMYNLTDSNITATSTDGSHNEDVTINIVYSEPPKHVIAKAIVIIIADLDAISEDIKKLSVKKYSMYDYIKEFNASKKI